MNTRSTTIKVSYEIKKDDKTEMHYFRLPISKERYAELAAGLSPENKAWNEVKDALDSLTRLQNGELGGWGLELLI